MIKIYLFFTYIIYPFLFLFLRMRVLFNKECPIRFKEKLGKINSNKCKNVIWFHVASLGEIKSIHSIIKHYQKNKNLNILITSVTQSSYEYFKENLQSYNTHHQYAPLDNPVIISKFLKNWKPKLSIFIESEIWPNMIMQTSKVSKIILLNCRISIKSFKKWRMFITTFIIIISKFFFYM
ncbi:MAG: glycosyltransferase N-terminal domain-containing protein, partial [Pelagibacteraceae bacterium]